MLKRNMKTTGRTSEISCAFLWSYFGSDLWYFTVTEVPNMVETDIFRVGLFSDQVFASA